ncbi:MAG: glycosyltransferase family 4 protein [Geminicoccaceae bacterium]
MNSQKKRIILLGGFAESLVVFRQPLLQAMVELGHSVTACAPDATKPLIERLEAIGVGYHDVPLDRTGLNPVKDAITIGALIALFRRERPDALLSYTIKPVIYGSLAAKAAGLPNAFAMITGAGKASTSQEGLKQWFARSMARLLYRQALKHNKAIMFQNPDDREMFKTFNLVRPSQHLVTLNGSGVDLEAFKPAPLPTEPPSFLLIARLIEEKGVREYVDAARAVKSRHPDASFRLVGWIDDQPGAIRRDELEAWIAEGTIEYLGRLDDVRPAIADSSVYVLPSYYPEGTPRSILEAMAMGRPIITTDMPGCRETVQEGTNGYLVPAQDQRQLVAAMERFIDQPDLITSFGQASLDIAKERYDVNKVNAAILDAMHLL